MARWRPGGNEDHVDPDIVVRAGIARHQHLGRGGDAGKPALVDREIEIGRGGARLDLDKGDQAAAAHNQIDFAGRSADPAIEDFPAFQPQPPGGAALAFAATRFRSAAIRWSFTPHDSHLWITLVTIARPSRTEPGLSVLSGGRILMESNERYYRRRAAQELAAAKRAMTEAAALRRRQLAETYLKRLAELTGADEMRVLEQEYA